MLHIYCKKNNKKPHPFKHVMASYLEMGRVRIPKFNQTLYSVTRINVLKFENDRSNRNCMHCEKALFQQMKNKDNTPVPTIHLYHNMIEKNNFAVV